jgi:hypothetical protein
MFADEISAKVADGSYIIKKLVKRAN